MATLRKTDLDFPERWGTAHIQRMELQENVPSPGRLTIVAWYDGALSSKTFEVSLKAFLAAANELAERMEAARESRTTADNPN